jgi:hypothetical protein
MSASEVLRHLLLQNTDLSNSLFRNAAEAISHLGAVQAQDFAAAKWALGLCVENDDDADSETDQKTNY